MSRRFVRVWLCVMLAGGMLAATGCSRKVLNYQIAESIGTLGIYENNEPVETPKMKAEREIRESEEAVEAALVETLARAEAMAQGYEYEGALALLENSEIDREDTRVTEAAARYQKGLEGMYEYDGVIPHLSFPNLIVDTARAFDGDGYSSGYDSTMITLSEFEKILQSLYDGGYFLIDLHSLTEMGTDENGQEALVAKNPVIPGGKKPMILSVDNLNYSQMANGDGIATRLDLDAQGKVKAVYTDAEGHDLVGDYDVVPVLESFIEEHPDFSFQGARGIIGLSGKYGAFGYPVEDEDNLDYSGNREKVKAIASALTAGGWSIACESYSYDRLQNYSYDQLSQDITMWQETVGDLVGDSDIIIFPYGSEVDYQSEKAPYLVSQGFRYFIGLWTTDDHRQIHGDYMRQTRRMVNGYVFRDSPNVYDAFFSTSGIWDENRP